MTNPRTAVEDALRKHRAIGAFDDRDTIADLGIDSLDLWEAIMDVEFVLGIEIKDVQVEDIKTVGSFIALAEKLSGVVA